MSAKVVKTLLGNLDNISSTNPAQLLDETAEISQISKNFESLSSEQQNIP